MRAVRCCDKNIEVVSVPEPAHDGVRVRIQSAGICGSDLHLLKMGIPLPNTFGHEFAGLLDDGSAVAVEPLLPCGTCDLCEAGRYNLCRRGTAMIMGVGCDGGMTDEIWVPDRCLVALTDDIPVKNACLVEPIAVAVHGIRDGGVANGDRVAIVGGGTIGLCAAAAAQDVGAEVSVIARHEHQVEAAQKLGSVALEKEYPVVIDCAGTSQALEQAVSLCAPGATLILLGSYWEGMTVPGMALCLKEVRVVPSSLYSGGGRAKGGHTHDTSDFERAAQILARRPEIADALITHRLYLDEAPRAFEIAGDRKAGAIKVVFEV